MIDGFRFPDGFRVEDSGFKVRIRLGTPKGTLTGVLKKGRNPERTPVLKLGNLGAATVRKDAKLIRSSGSTRALIGQCSGLGFSYGLRLGSTVL